MFRDQDVPSSARSGWFLPITLGGGASRWGFSIAGGGDSEVMKRMVVRIGGGKESLRGSPACFRQQLHSVDNSETLVETGYSSQGGTGSRRGLEDQSP